MRVSIPAVVAVYLVSILTVRFGKDGTVVVARPARFENDGIAVSRTTNSNNPPPPVESLLPGHILSKWKKTAGCKEDANLPLQVVDTTDNSVVFPSYGRVSLDDMDEFSVLSSSAKCYSNGIETSCPPPSTFIKRMGNTKIVVTKDVEGTITSVSARGPGKAQEVLQHVRYGVLTYVSNDDIDPDLASRYRLGDDESVILGTLVDVRRRTLLRGQVR
eukprot:CAMPEP_0113503764 /NCGR_PEP_ID=MMETSP0014_2-20120614/34346_1 /TAXON_ID=2857 /ORGANISM="Nitzschia sp." /LENGTH=216 /DNA_ID=CAMNT_0000398809 /DNA_START=749 /DNA_END=1395 /DNA_ORIENTATION=+ /assembly_acc=CAM_ASM_000159